MGLCESRAAQSRLGASIMMFRKALATAIFLTAVLVSGTANPLLLGSSRGGVSSDGGGPPPTPPPWQQAPTNIAWPTISGTSAVGSTLTATNEMWTNSPTSFAYQWLPPGAAIAGATSASYAVRSADATYSIAVTVTATNARGSASATSAAVGAIPTPPSGVPGNTAPPAISGSPWVGSILRVSNGRWTNSPMRYAYTWQIGSATATGVASYTLQSQDLGKTITLTVTADNSVGTSSPVTTASVTVVNPPAPMNTTAPYVVATEPYVGDDMIVAPGRWDNLASSFTFQWKRNGANIAGATQQIYHIQAADLNNALTVTVTAVNAGGSTSVITPATAKVTNPQAASGACGGWASSTVRDGCYAAPTANAYTIQRSNFFTSYARQNGQSWVSTGGCGGRANCHPPWAVAGVDFPVGPSTLGSGFGHPGGATDPTIGANYANGNPANCNRGGSNLINCLGTTSQVVDIGPFDFSWQGNSTGVGMSLQTGGGITGPCIIHDSYFVFDINASTKAAAVSPYNLTGCTSLILRNNVFRLRNAATGELDAQWTTPGSVNTQYSVLVGGSSLGSQSVNRPVVVANNAFINCASRCLAVGSVIMRNNYFEGINMYELPGYAYHGDGWMTSLYNGPSGPAQTTCNCDGVDYLMEKFDTWLVPTGKNGPPPLPPTSPWGAGSTTCLSCALVNAPAGTIYGTTDGAGHLSVTSLSISSYSFANVGAVLRATRSNGNYARPAGPSPAPAVAQCKDAQGNVGCSLTQAQSCSELDAL